jgi:hypothetical protein
MKNEKELLLRLKKELFLKILKGEKKELKRDFTEYYIDKLCVLDKERNIIGQIQYDNLRIQLGYSSSELQIGIKGVFIEKYDDVKEDEELTEDNCNFSIELGKIIQEINCDNIKIMFNQKKRKQ